MLELLIGDILHILVWFDVVIQIKYCFLFFPTIEIDSFLCVYLKKLF